MIGAHALLNDATTLAFVLHIGGGTIGLVSGTVTIFSPKGGYVHRRAGTVFFVSMLVMATFAIFLAVVTPGEIVNLIVGTLVFYLVATAWLTVWRKAGKIGTAEKIALFVIVCLCAPLSVLSIQLAVGSRPFFKSALPLEGPVLVAIYIFTFVVAIAAVADARMVLAGGISGAPRIARHLWRMSVALTLATGSAFTNGLPRLMPGPFHSSNLLLLPQLVPLALLVFWMIRVRLTGWYRRSAAAATATA